jgi:hypothetical protein
MFTDVLESKVYANQASARCFLGLLFVSEVGGIHVYIPQKIINFYRSTERHIPNDTVTCMTTDLIWIDDLSTIYTEDSGTTSNYSAPANLHNSQITTAHAKPLPPCLPWE